MRGFDLYGLNCVITIHLEAYITEFKTLKWSILEKNTIKKTLKRGENSALNYIGVNPE